MGMGMTLFMEAFVTIHMSVFVLLPLSKLISKDNSRKIFWTLYRHRGQRYPYRCHESIR